MAHLVSSPHPFLTARPVTLDSANSKMVQDSFFRINDYSNSAEKGDTDKPLDFSKKKQEPSLSQHKDETCESSNLLEHLQCSKSTSIPQKEITTSRDATPRCISPLNSTPANNSEAYATPPPFNTLVKQYVKAFRKYNPILPKQNHIPLAELLEQDNGHHELAPLCKMIENQNFNGTLISPVVRSNVTSLDFSTTSRNNSPPVEVLTNNLKFHNSTAFTPIVLGPPPNTRVNHVSHEQITKTSNFSAPEDVGILQRTLTAPHQLDDHGAQRSAKQTRPFKAYNPTPNPFPTSFHVMPLGVLQDLEEQEYRYQQYMQRFYTDKNPKTRPDTRSQEPVDNQAGSSGDDRMESPTTSDSPSRPPTSDQNKSFESSNDISVDVQMSRRQAADTSTSPNNNRNVKRVRALPDELKDAAYWERRRKNNEAAKRSRDTRRQKEDFIAMRARFLEDENKNLRLTIAILRQELNTIKCCAAHNHKIDSKEYNEMPNSNSLQYFRKH